MSLSLGGFVKRNLVSSRQLDKKKGRIIRNEKENFKIMISEKLNKFNITSKASFIENIMLIKNIKNLNIELVIIVYIFCEKRQFSLDLIIDNFNDDFLEEVEKINMNGYFNKIIDKKNISKFREDFVIYMFLILNDEEEEENFDDDEKLEFEEIDPLNETDVPCVQEEDEFILAEETQKYF